MDVFTGLTLGIGRRRSFPEIWSSGECFAEIEVLVLRPAMRRKRVREALMAAVDTIFAVRGVPEQIVGAIEPNVTAIRFYVRRGSGRSGWS